MNNIFSSQIKINYELIWHVYTSAQWIFINIHKNQSI